MMQKFFQDEVAMYTEGCDHQQGKVFWGLCSPLVHHERNSSPKSQDDLSQHVFLKGAFFPAICLPFQTTGILNYWVIQYGTTFNKHLLQLW